MKIKKTTTFINNRKAHYNYYIDDTYTAGIVLSGSEVKSIRAGHANIGEAYCYFQGNEFILKNAHITSSTKNTMFGHEEIHDRKLLLTKKELKSIKRMLEMKGYTAIPLSIVIPSYGYIKVNIGICRGKHNYDKRDTIKERDYQRSIKDY